MFVRDLQGCISILSRQIGSFLPHHAKELMQDASILCHSHLACAHVKLQLMLAKQLSYYSMSRLI
jgi:hypothetical protein